MDKLTRNMSTQLFTGASKQLKTRLSTVTIRCLVHSTAKYTKAIFKPLLLMRQGVFLRLTKNWKLTSGSLPKYPKYRVKIWAKISKSEQKKVIFTTCFLGVPDHAESKKIGIVKSFVLFFVFFSSEWRRRASRQYLGEKFLSPTAL
jgi:hypothetical protein